MSRKSRHHLAPVPASPTAPALPGPRSYTERLELPTGGRPDGDGLLRELCRVAFRGSLVGFEVTLDGRFGLRCFASVRVGEQFSAEQLDQGRLAITRALVVLGVVQVKPAAVPPAAEEPKDGAESPPPPSPPS